jgi:ABC-type nitrate/sulfonate/bicarbonate transport system substrate-binding protein
MEGKLRRRLRTLFFRAAYNLPVTLGLARGVFARHGLDLDVHYTQGSRMTVEWLGAGTCDLAVLAADDVVYEVEAHGADIVMFMGLHRGILALVARPGLRVPDDLPGARLGVDDPASGFALVAHHLLGVLGVNGYTTVAAGGVEHRARALAAGTIDVTLLTPPFTLQTVARGGTLVARAHDHLPRYQASGGVTTRRWAARNRDALVAYIRAYRESVAWALDPANREAATAHLAEAFGLSAAHAAETWAALADPADGLLTDGRIEPEGLRTVLDLRVQAGLLAPAPRPLERYCDLAHLAAASA